MLVERPGTSVGEGETIASGVDGTLDELRAIAIGGKDAIAAMQTAERERTGIASLKVGYNRVFGYFIEVTNTNAHLVPPDYQRRQTLTGAERYITPALKEFEEKVLHATERIETLERQLFEALRSRAGAQIGRLQGVASTLARLDVLGTLAEVAAREGYVRPEVRDGMSLEITGGRHPVVERMMPREQFIPNDVTLTPDARMIILTGPNMAGKSTFLRCLNRMNDTIAHARAEGSILLDGQDIYAPDCDLTDLRRRVGMVFQTPNPFPMSIYENVAFAAEVIGRPRAAIRSQVPQILELVGLSEKADRFPNELSGGEQQRVSIARAFVNRPLILLADEPTGNLDSKNGEAVMELLKELHREGATICMVTHDERYSKHAERTIHLFDGKVVNGNSGSN